MQEIGLETQSNVGKKSAEIRKYHNPVPKKENQKRKYKKYPEFEKTISEKEKPREKKAFTKAEKLHQQVRQGLYYIWKACHNGLYQHNVRIFYSQNHNIFTSGLHNPVASSNAKIYVCERCHKPLSHNVT